MRKTIQDSTLLLLVVLLFFNACDGGGGSGGSNRAPTVSITSPADGAQFAGGASVVFQCIAADPEDGTLTGASLVWTSSLDGDIGTGESCTRDDLSVGTHTVTLTATDSRGASASDSITVHVRPPNQPPTVSVTSPTYGTTFVQGSSVAFQGSALDPEDGALTGASLVWTSSLDGNIGTGESFVRDDLSMGFHIITLTGTDSEGASASDSVTIRIRLPNQPPAVGITSPPDGATFDQGSSVTFEGGAIDSEDGLLTGSRLVWRSSLDGAIGTGRSFTRDDLSVGTHTITLTATDSEGAFASSSVIINIRPSNQPATATITNPTDGATFVEGNPIVFQGSAADPEDGLLTGASLVWTSGLDGHIGTAESFTRDDLSVGTHAITLTATDSEGGSGSDSITIEVTDQVGPGIGHVYLLKTDSYGSLEWQRTFGGGTGGLGCSVQQTTDGGYVIGSTISPSGYDDLYLLKTDPFGILEWEKAFGGPDNDQGSSVQETADGGYILAGETRSFGAGGSDFYLVKTDHVGTLEWEKTFGGTGDDRGWWVRQTADGGYIITGQTDSFGVSNNDVYLVKTGSSGGLEWEKTLGGGSWDAGISVQQTTDGGYVITGVTGSFGDGDVYLVKTDSSGDPDWQNTFGGYNYWGCSVQQTTDGGYIIAGGTEWPGEYNNSDVYLVKTDSHGNLLWEKTYGGADADWGFSVQQTTDGGYVVAGWANSSRPGRADVYLVKTDSHGNLLWEKTYGGSFGDWGCSVQQTTDGGYIIAGFTYSFGAALADHALREVAQEDHENTRGQAISRLRNVHPEEPDR